MSVDGVYIKNMEMPPAGCILIVFPSGRVLKVSSDQTQNIYGEAEAVPVPPHGRLIDESEIDLSKYEKAAHDALHNGKGSILYDSGVLAGARAITQLVRRAPTIIPADKEE